MKNEDRQITMRAVADLVPYANNARIHTDSQVDQLCESIKHYGWTNPILIDGEDGIIAGHCRLAAAQKLGLKQVPCIELKGLKPADKKALILADNRLTLGGSWDYQILAQELEEIRADGLDLDFTGFNADEQQMILGEGEINDDFFTEEATDHSADSEHFQETFVFPNEEKEAVKAYLKARGKEWVAHWIIQQAHGEAAKND